MINITKLNNKFPYLKIHGSDTSIHTPFSLVNEIIEKLPINWSDQKLTFLDPCCGRGTFLIVIYNKLFEGLKSIIKDEIERRNHIINNQIYGVDINQINVLLSKKYLYNSKNLICADSLEYNFNMKFDVVIGNPPYQPPINILKEQGKKVGSGNKIWHKFIEKAFEITHDKSVIAMITPSHWRLGNFSRSSIKDIQSKMWKYKFIDIKNANAFFGDTLGNMVIIDYWIIDKSRKNDIDLSLQNVKYYPLKYSINSLVDYFESQKKENFVLDISLNDSRKFDCIRCKEKSQGVYQYKHFNTWAQYKKKCFDWYSVKTKGFDSKKVIITTVVGLNKPGNELAFFDKNAEFGCGHAAMGYTVKNNLDGEKLVNFLNNSKIIKAIYNEFNNGNGFSVPVQAYKKIPMEFVERFNNGEDL